MQGAGGCIDPLFIPTRFEAEREELEQREADGEVTWQDGEPILTGNPRRYLDRWPEREPDYIEQLKSLKGLAPITCTWREDIPGSDRHPLLPAEEAAILNQVVTMAAKVPSLSGNHIDPAILVPGLRIAPNDEITCAYHLGISQAIYHQDWAFISAFWRRPPLAGSGKTWALHLEEGTWRIRGYILDWIS